MKQFPQVLWSAVALLELSSFTFERPSAALTVVNQIFVRILYNIYWTCRSTKCFNNAPSKQCYLFTKNLKLSGSHALSTIEIWAWAMWGMWLVDETRTLVFLKRSEVASLPVEDV